MPSIGVKARRLSSRVPFFLGVCVSSSVCPSVYWCCLKEERLESVVWEEEFVLLCKKPSRFPLTSLLSTLTLAKNIYPESEPTPRERTAVHQRTAEGLCMAG